MKINSKTALENTGKTRRRVRSGKRNSRVAMVTLVLGFCSLFIPATGLKAQEVPLPELESRVMDQTGTLSATELQMLRIKLQELETEKGSQIGILILPTVGDVPIEDFSIRLAEKWQLGRAGVDDGVIIIVAKNDRKVRIEVGYGLEGAIPDAIANRIVDQIIVPAFRQGEFFGGLDGATDALVSLIDGEPLPTLEEEPLITGGDSEDSGFGGFLFFVVVAGAFIVRIVYNSFVAMGVVLPIAIILGWIFIGFSVPMLFSAIFATAIGAFGRGGGSGGSFSSSGGGFSSGGGGFSGGGGSFGGGGASGSW